MNINIFNYIIIFSFLMGGVLLEAKSPKDSNIDSIYQSSYSSIAPKDCQTLESDNLGSIEECESFDGMKVVVIEGDIKQTIVLSRDNRRYELDFGSLVSQGYISLHSDLEWIYRYEDFNNPISMILRLKVNDNSGDKETTTPYALVSKITEKDICVVSKIKIENKISNEFIHKIAEKSNEMPCLSLKK